jgi:uncharacterized protein (TIGR01777 family)
MKTLIINGASGFLGNQILQFLKGKYNIITLKRNHYLLPPNKLAEKIEGCDYILNIAGAPISQMWTKKARTEIFNSRINTTQNLVSCFNYLNKKPLLFISTSGINIYADSISHSEDSIAFGTGFLSDVCIAWEQEALLAAFANIPVTIIRPGIVLSPEGGFLQQINRTVPYKFLVKFGRGIHNFPFIDLHDYLHALLFILEGNYSGIYNFVAPNPVNYQTFYRIYLNKSKCWTVLPIPSFLLKLLPAHQGDFFMRSPLVVPQNLLSKGFRFLYPSIDDSINALKLPN